MTMSLIYRQYTDAVTGEHEDFKRFQTRDPLKDCRPCKPKVPRGPSSPG